MNREQRKNKLDKLEKLYQAKLKEKQDKEASNYDFSHLSDEELNRLLEEGINLTDEELCKMFNCSLDELEFKLEEYL